ncbi:putative Transcription factor IIIB 90 kDa subunit, partial [Daphnia magna]
ALQQPVSPASCTSGISSPSADPEVDDVIADMTMTAVKECLTPTEVAAVEANTLPTAGTTDPGADESALMPPPGATYLQLRHHTVVINLRNSRRQQQIILFMPLLKEYTI